MTGFTLEILLRPITRDHLVMPKAVFVPDHMEHVRYSILDVRCLECAWEIANTNRTHEI